MPREGNKVLSVKFLSHEARNSAKKKNKKLCFSISFCIASFPCFALIVPSRPFPSVHPLIYPGRAEYTSRELLSHTVWEGESAWKIKQCTLNDCTRSLSSLALPSLPLHSAKLHIARASVFPSAALLLHFSLSRDVSVPGPNSPAAIITRATEATSASERGREASANDTASKAGPER